MPPHEQGDARTLRRAELGGLRTAISGCAVGLPVPGITKEEQDNFGRVGATLHTCLARESGGDDGKGNERLRWTTRGL